jgi:hypothetical protein
MSGCGLDTTGLGCEPVVGCCESSIGTSGPMRGRLLLDCRRICLVLKLHSVNSHYFLSDHMDWIGLSLDKDRWRAIVNALMDLLHP